MFHNTLKVRHDILKQFENVSDEPFLHVYKDNLTSLIDIVKTTGEELEGNIFFGHGSKDISSNKFDASLKKKREGLALFALSKTRVVEVGFNAGFSTLLMLSANPELEVVSVDVGYHSYVQPCAKYLKEVFGSRFKLILGDSRDALPLLFANDRKFDGYHIDGSHDAVVAETDLCNVINNASNGSVICFDDTDFAQLRRVITLYMLQGTVSHVFDPNGQLASKDQMFLRINK